MRKMIKEEKYFGKKNNKNDSPLVSILMAVYKPNEKWLIEQLVSLNEQIYNNLELLVYDDCPNFPVQEDYFKKYITNFNYTLIRGTENQGSNKAFEELTKNADGEFFAYCDQDDIWEKEKISVMMKKFIEDDVTLVYSDLLIIDEKSMTIANSLTDIRKRIVYKSGYNLAEELLMTNFVTGCALVVKKNIAKKSIPFEETLIHDQWIAIMAALNGKIEFINKPLVKYRRHGNNQTGILKDIYDKKTYYNKRIDEFIYRYKSLETRLNYDEVKAPISNSLMWLNARKNYFFNPSIKDLKIMHKYRNFHKISIMIELILPFMPEVIFRYIIKLAKKGVL